MNANKSMVLVLAVCLGVSQMASGLTITRSVGGAPTAAGVYRLNFDAFALGGATQGSGAGDSGVTVSFVPGAQVVQGAAGGLYAAPYLSGGNGLGFGSPDQPNGADGTRYLTTGTAGSSVTMQFDALKMYFGLLWGSVDLYNTLTFYSGASVVGSLVGADVFSSPAGNQGVNGTVYVNIDSDVGFDRVVATSANYAFEFDNVAFSSARQVPDGGAVLALFGGAMAGMVLLRRRFA